MALQMFLVPEKKHIKISVGDHFYREVCIPIGKKILICIGSIEIIEKPILL